MTKDIKETIEGLKLLKKEHNVNWERARILHRDLEEGSFINYKDTNLSL